MFVAVDSRPDADGFAVAERQLAEHGLIRLGLLRLTFLLLTPGVLQLEQTVHQQTLLRRTKTMQFVIIPH